MAYSKVIVNDKVIIDLENDTVDAGHLVSGYTAHDASGELVSGTIPVRTETDLKILDDERLELPAGYYPEKITIWLNTRGLLEWGKITSGKEG